MRPLTDTTPKPLIPIAGRGSLLRSLDILPDAVTRVILVVGYLHEQIRDAVGATWNGRSVTYLLQEKLNGTGGALRLAQEKISSDRFLVLNGDDLYGADDLQRLTDVDRGLLVMRRRLHKQMDTLVVHEGRIRGLSVGTVGEDPSINIGAYMLGHEWYTTRPTLVPGKETEWSLPHALPQLFDSFDYRAVDATFWQPCGTFEEIAAAEAKLLSS